MLRDDLRRRGLLGVRELSRLFARPRKSFELHPTRELIEAYGIAGAMIDPDPVEGIRELFVGTARYFSATWYGRTFARFLHPDPGDALDWIERSREHVANYGRWRVERRRRDAAVIHMFDEYFWIEGAQRGGCEGLLSACGMVGEVRAELDSPYTGRLHVRWEPRGLSRPPQSGLKSRRSPR